jgi:hypothetical protein
MMRAFGRAVENAAAMSDEELEAYERRLDAEIDADGPAPAVVQLSMHVRPRDRRCVAALKKLGFAKRNVKGPSPSQARRQAPPA